MITAYFNNYGEVNKSNMEKIWNEVIATPPPPNRVLDAKTKNMMRKKYVSWVRAPRTRLVGKTFDRAFMSAANLYRALLGEVMAERAGGGKDIEKNLAKLIGQNNKRIYKLLYTAIDRIHKDFHMTMKTKPQYIEKCKKVNRHYAYYYSPVSAQIGSIFKAVKTVFFAQGQKKMFHTDHKSLISVENGFKHILKNKPKGSWRLIAFLADYGRVVKTVFPEYFTEMAGPEWNDSEIQYQVSKQMKKNHMKKEVYRQAKLEYDKKSRLKKLFTKKSTLRKKAGDRQKQELIQDFKDQGFDRLDADNDHMFYRLPHMTARTMLGGSGVNESDEWVRKGREAGVVLDNGPSATTAFTLGLLQILYPHEDTVLAAALALFEFWQDHYRALHSGVHTWHEIMVVVQPFSYNFNFVKWKKVDAKPPKNWMFGYPERAAFISWLKG